MNRLVRFFLLLFLVFILISLTKFLAVSRLMIIGILLVTLIAAVIWILSKAFKKPR